MRAPCPCNRTEDSVGRPRLRRLFFTAAAVLWSIGLGTGSADRSVPLPGTFSDSAGGGFLLNEVLFLPADGHPQFVELKNASGAEADPTGLALVNHSGETFPLPSGVGAITPGAVVLVVFDGQNRVEGTTVHADRTGFLHADSGSVDLRDSGGSRIDSVGWSGDHPFAVATSTGGIDRPPNPGTTIGRFPLSATPLDRFAWSPFDRDQVTPGTANPNSPVAGLLPITGAVLPPSSIKLSWYTAAGARQYRVQVASDEAFTALMLDRTTSENTLLTDPLPSGTYFWRVQAIAADAASAPFSSVSEIRVDPSLLVAALSDALEERPKVKSSTAGVLSETELKRDLDVPLIKQRKDTEMLLLETSEETGQHAWDVDHLDFSWSDDADNMNCALAGIVMVNNFLGGTLSQDRLGFELHKHRRPGPEMDLQWGKPGPRENQLAALASFALGAPAFLLPKPTGAEAFWSTVKAEIDAGRPVITFTKEHTQVIKGYIESEEGRQFLLNDPIMGEYVIDASRPEPIVGLPWQNYLLVPPSHRAFKDEPGIQQDSDGDGVVDFDETNRFGTDPYDPDSDDDKVEDKDDIRASVFDPVHGYALNPNGKGRDFDGDGVPMELDRDSDNGGCSDGLEDLNFNGKRDARESWNFDTQDDGCLRWEGEVHYEKREGGEGGSAVITMHTRVTFASTPEVPDIYSVASGTVSYRVTSVTGSCTSNLGPIPVSLGRDDGFLSIDTTEDPPRYWGGGELPVGEGTATLVCPDGSWTLPAPIAGIWFYALSGLFTVKPDGFTIEDTYADHNGTWQWRFVRGGAAP